MFFFFNLSLILSLHISLDFSLYRPPTLHLSLRILYLWQNFTSRCCTLYLYKQEYAKFTSSLTCQSTINFKFNSFNIMSREIFTHHYKNQWFWGDQFDDGFRRCRSGLCSSESNITYVLRIVWSRVVNHIYYFYSFSVMV